MPIKEKGERVVKTQTHTVATLGWHSKFWEGDSLSGKRGSWSFAVFVFCFRTEVALGSFIFRIRMVVRAGRQCRYCSGGLVLLRRICTMGSESRKPMNSLGTPEMSYTVRFPSPQRGGI